MNEELFKQEFEKAWAVLEQNMAHHFHDKDAIQTAHGFTFKSTVPVEQLENLEQRLSFLYINEGRGKNDYPHYQISNVGVVFGESNKNFDWSKAKVAESRGNYSRY